MKKIILTGDRPTGQLHLGHYVGSLLNRVTLQNDYEQYIMIADMQALTDYFDRPSTITNSVEELVKDYIGVGIDPSLSTIFIQSQIKELATLTMLYLNLVTTSRLERNPTIKTEIQLRGFNDSIPAGFLCYPVSQAADITLFKAELVPAGEDQAPLIEQTNEIVRRFNRIYNTDCLKETKMLLSNCPRLVGIDGKAKASKSLHNAIFLADPPEVIKEKIFSMYTDPDHLRVSDPGKVEGNVVFTYLDVFHPDKEEVAQLKKDYQRGGLGDIKIKGILNDTMQTLLAPIRDKRNAVTSTLAKEILHAGISKAQKVAEETMKEIKDAVGIGYNFC